MNRSRVSEQQIAFILRQAGKERRSPKSVPLNKRVDPATILRPDAARRPGFHSGSRRSPKRACAIAIGASMFCFVAKAGGQRQAGLATVSQDGPAIAQQVAERHVQAKLRKGRAGTAGPNEV